MQSYFNPETQRVKAYGKLITPYLPPLNSNKAHSYAVLLLQHLSATLFGVAIGLLYPLLLALDKLKLDKVRSFFGVFVWSAFNRQPPFPHLGGIL